MTVRKTGVLVCLLSFVRSRVSKMKNDDINVMHTYSLLIITVILVVSGCGNPKIVMTDLSDKLQESQLTKIKLNAVSANPFHEFS